MDRDEFIGIVLCVLAFFALAMALGGCTTVADNLDKAITHETMPAKRGWFEWYCSEPGYTIQKPAHMTDIPECVKD